MSDDKFPELPSDEELGITDEDLEHLPDDDGPEMTEEEMRALLGEEPKPQAPPARSKAGKPPKEPKPKASKAPKTPKAPKALKTPRETSPAPPSRWRGPAMLALLALLGFLSSPSRFLPAPVGPDAPDDAFSSGRAMAHLRQIARGPHPTGSPEHARVRAYVFDRLRDLGVQPTVETATSVVGRGTRVRAATVRNIVARVPGTASTGTVLLTAHYDAAGIAGGAGDDGLGVVAILETLRALRAGPPLPNDLLVLITDGEELGLMGARAFVRDSPLMADVSVVLSVDNRGGGGPSIMFETGVENGWIVREMAASGVRPAANSVGYELYKRLPNDTDFTPFREAGRQGLNFAAIGRASVYHQAYDTPDNLQVATLQHHGENLLGVTRRLGAADLSAVDAPDAAYFSVPLVGVVTYDGGLAGPIGMVLLALAVVAVLGGRRASGTWSGILAGVGLAIVVVAGSAGTGYGLFRWLRQFHPEFGSLVAGAFHHEGWYVLALSAFSLGITTTLLGLARRRWRAGMLTLGALLPVLGLATWLAFSAPMAAMDLQWPLAAALLGLVALLARDTSRTVGLWWAWAALCAVPVAAVLFPVVEFTWVALGFGAAPVIGGLIGCASLLLLPALDRLREPNGWWAPLSGLVLGTSFVGLGIREAGATAERPAPAALAYALDRGTGEALWITDDSQDEVDAPARAWVESVVGGPVTQTRSVGRFGIGTPRGGEARVAPAPATQPAPPSLGVMMDTIFSGERLMRLAIRSNLGAELVQLRVPDGSPARVTSVNFQAVETTEPPRLVEHWGVPETAIVLDLTLPAGVEPDLTVIEHLFHTEALLGPNRFQRPPTLAPDVRWASDRAMLLGTLSDLTVEEGREPPPTPEPSEPVVPAGAGAPAKAADSTTAGPADSLVARPDTSGAVASDTTMSADTTGASGRRDRPQ
jgi:hypothetical protein